MLRIVAVAALLALPLAPAASAHGCYLLMIPGICVSEHEFGTGDCETSGWRYQSTSVFVQTERAQAQVVGFESCGAHSGGAGTSSGFGVILDTGETGPAGANWHGSEGSFGSECTISAHSHATGRHSLDCPAGLRPALPWGRVLP